jgi:predicted CoA-binding protein
MGTDERAPVPGWIPPGANARKEILDRSTTVAIIGASSNPARASNFVATYLLSSSADFDVYLVNPRESEILGEPVYGSLAELPVTPDIVDVFRRSEDLPEIAEEAIAVGAKALWIQLGLWNAEAAQLATEAGLDVVMGRCLKIEHARFHGGLHLAGFDTGVISSRRRRR